MLNSAATCVEDNKQTAKNPDIEEDKTALLMLHAICLIIAA